MSAHASHASWPHMEFHRKPQRQRPRAVPHVGTPLTRFVSPHGAPPKAPVAAPACGSTTPFRHTPHTFRGPVGSSTE
eukprot:370253-Pyramimonas_sp.AAC.1